MSNEIGRNLSQSVDQARSQGEMEDTSAYGSAHSAEQRSIIDQPLPEYASVLTIEKYAPREDFPDPHITHAQLELLEEYGITGLKMEHDSKNEVYTLSQEEWDRLHELMTPVMKQMTKKAQLMVIKAKETLKGYEIAMDCADQIRRNENI